MPLSTINKHIFTAPQREMSPILKTLIVINAILALTLIWPAQSTAKWVYLLPNSPMPQTKAVSSANGALHIIGANGSVSTTFDGKSWRYSLIPSFGGYSGWGYDFDTTKNAIYYRGGGYVFQSRDTAKTWSTIYYAEGNVAVSIVSNNDTLYMITEKSQIFRHDSSNKWTFIGSGQAGKMLRTDSLWLSYPGNNKVYSSIDGKKWSNSLGPGGINDIKKIKNDVGVCEGDSFTYYKQGINPLWRRKAKYCSFADSAGTIFINTDDSTFIVDSLGSTIFSFRREIKGLNENLAWHAGTLYSVQEFGYDPYYSILTMKNRKWSHFDSTTQQHTSIASSPNGTFVSVGSRGKILYRTKNGEFTPALVPTNIRLNRVIWSKNQFIAVGDSSTLLTSQDGSKWEVESQAIQGNYQSIATYKDSIFFLLSDTSLLSSENLRDWKLICTYKQIMLHLAIHDTLISISTRDSFYASSVRSPHVWRHIPELRETISLENCDSGFLVATERDFYLSNGINSHRILSYGTVVGIPRYAIMHNSVIYGFVDNRAFHWDRNWKIYWDEMIPVDADISGIAGHEDEIIACGWNGQIIKYFPTTNSRATMHIPQKSDIAIIPQSPTSFMITGSDISASSISIHDFSGRRLPFTYYESKSRILVTINRNYTHGILVINVKNRKNMLIAIPH